ncbi:hypothetical protein ACFWRV_14980 [Streptomyces sp. NPDC058576]|uniref:AMIN-like domain-containing (lipo)protein n=1 Tax=Streptomyces sp. NPDC058576 TaxID=3346547 RepID=UPI0036472322
MRARRVAGWSNVALASTVVMALSACGGEGGKTEDGQGQPAAATSSLEPSETSSATAGEESEQNGSAEPPEVTAVTVTETAEGDRVTFAFDGPAPDHLDSYEKTLSGAEGRTIEIKGSKFLRVAFVGVSPDSRFTPPAGNERILEVRYLTNFESEMSVGIGIVAPDGAADPAYDITAEGHQVFVDIKD